MGWAGEVQKQKILPREHQMKKNSCYGLRKSYKKFDNEKFLRVENFPPPPPTPPPPPITFLMVRPMMRDVELAIKTSVWRED